MKTFRLAEPHLSLTPFEWRDIPPLVVLTGANGVGKTQLLELLAGLGKKGFFEPEVPGEAEPVPRFVGYLHALWTGSNPKIVQQDRDPIDALLEVFRWIPEAAWAAPPVESEPSNDLGRQFLGALIFSDVTSRPNGDALLRALRARGVTRPLRTREEVSALLRPYDLVTRDPRQPLETLAQVIHAYYHQLAERLAQGEDRRAVIASLGEPPWQLADHLLGCFGLRYVITPPDSLRYPYVLRCRDPQRNVTLTPSALSSGEQAVLALIALAVTTSVFAREGGSPHQVTDLLVLDEPDAHLHTSLVKDYLQHLRELAAKDVQIVMVTHRPDTIALAPPDTLYELTREGDLTAVVKVASRSELIARLTGQTIAVLPAVRIVLVEDMADQRFHAWAYRRALALKLLPELPSLAFLSAVAVKGGGGKAAVYTRIAALGAQHDHLLAVYRGLVDDDGDQGRTTLPAGVVHLDRYAIENYFADPIALYSAVVNSPGLDELLSWSTTCGVARGDLATLRAADAQALRPIATFVFGRLEDAASRIEDAVSFVAKTPFDVVLHGDHGTVTLTYPGWLQTAPKSALRAVIRELHPKAGPGLLNADHLNGGPELAGLVPADLVNVYRRLIGDSRQPTTTSDHGRS